MKNSYTPKVGDKVRATLGESVVIGEVADTFGNNGNRIQIDTAVESYAICDRSDGWQFEQVVSAPSKFGAVIRRADGKVYTRIEKDAWMDEGWCSYRNETVTAGGFSVLFDGVDE